MTKKKDGKPIAFGWIKDPSDPRDQLYASIRQLGDSQIPPSFDLMKLMPPVEYQGAISSCVACALTGALEFLQLKNNADKKKKRRLKDVSKMFIYYNARLIDHLESMDRGCIIRSAVKSLVDYGACQENTWKYTDKNLFKKPTKLTYWLAIKKIIKDYYKIATADPNSIKAALAEGYPVVFGTVLFDSFLKTGPDGIVPIPNPKTEKVLGGHAMLIVGYNEKYFIVRNSWGSWWGNKGYCFFPIEYFSQLSSMSFDFWVIRQELGV